MFSCGNLKHITYGGSRNYVYETLIYIVSIETSNQRLGGNYARIGGFTLRHRRHAGGR